MQQQNLFYNSVRDDRDSFSDIDRRAAWERATATLWDRYKWDVDDNYHSAQEKRFAPDASPFIEMTTENGSGVFEGIAVPKGLMDFVAQKFLPSFNLHMPKQSSIHDIIVEVFRFLDWEEPYFFLVDMPVSIVKDDKLLKTYKNKRDNSVLDPDRLELFKVQFGWKFPHYTYVHKLLSDPRTAAIAAGQYVAHPRENRPMHTLDVLGPVVEAVFYNNWDWFYTTVDKWIEIYYDNLAYSAGCDGIESLYKLREDKDSCGPFWYAVAAGVMTWLKSPHGLKFLIMSHPVYEAVLDWNWETNTPNLVKDSGGLAIVSGWTIYTLADVEEISVPAGTCCVLGEPLHCTKLVNVKAVKNLCACGYPRNIMVEDYYEDHHHTHAACREWAMANPAQMVFISFGALENIVEGHPTGSECSRYSCPRTSCRLHAGQAARLGALTKQRTQMLTSSRPR